MRTLVAAFAAVIVAGYSTGGSSAPVHTPSTGAASGCGSTSIFNGTPPDWLNTPNNPVGLPYVLAKPPEAAGFLFAQPLRAGHPGNPANKILWVVHVPRNGSVLHITGHPVGTTAPTIDQIEPANSSPGEIYPSIVDVPQRGCWQFDLAWAGNKASVELLYQ